MQDNHINLLLVEDDPDDAELIRLALRQIRSVPLEVTHAMKVREAVGYLDQQSFDVILLDLGLPDCQGIETFIQIHNRAPEVPIVVATVMEEEAVALQVVREGAQDYLFKGEVNGELLMRSIRYAIERKRGEELAREVDLKLEEFKRYEAVHSAREDERKILAAEIHDDVMGRLGALAMDLMLLRAETNGHRELKTGIVEAREKVDETVRRLREIVQGIYPASLTNLGLLKAVTSHLSELALRPIINPYSIEVSLRAKGFGDCKLPETQGIAIYRTIEQSIANIIAHAQASTVRIHLVWGEATIELCISDDGKGFDQSGVNNAPLTGHFGLANLRYRTEALRGTFDIESQLDLGTTIRSTIPTESPGAGPGEVLATTVLLTAAAPFMGSRIT